MNFELILPRKIIFGEGSITKIGDEVKRLGSKSPLVVTSNGMLKREGFNQAIGVLRKHGLYDEIFSDVIPDPTLENMLEVTALARKGRCDSFIGFGGGSVMDVAKKAAAELNLPKIMIPTTAGTGSEVTYESVLKINGMKRAFVDEKLTPDVALVDPELSLTAPPKLAAACGIDALAHAIECYQSKRGNSISKVLAFEAYTIIIENLRKTINKDGEAMVNMSLGSLMAGMAFANSGTTLGHALSYPLSNRGIHHGEAVAIVLPFALEFNGFADAYRIKRLIKDIGLLNKFEGDIQDMAKTVMEDTRHLSNNPRPVNFKDVLMIYERIRNESEG